MPRAEQVHQASAERRPAEGLEWVGRFTIGTAVVVSFMWLAGCITFFMLRGFVETEANVSLLTSADLRGFGLYVASWIVLLGISLLAAGQVREVLRAHRDEQYRTRANYIAVIIGLVLTIFLFKQPYLDRVFGRASAGDVLNVILFSGGAATGWIVWYLRNLSRYGEFFHVLLFTVVIGICWYARLTAPEEVQLTAVAFLLGSLCKLAKDYLDRAAEVSAGSGKVAA